MPNVYKTILTDISNIFFTASVRMFDVLPQKVRAKALDGRAYTDTSSYSRSSGDAIRKDFEKIGKDLFKALNAYEQTNGFNLTPR